MSQRIFRSGDMEILSGWDRPLQRFFLVIESDAQQASAGDAYVFDNLARANPAMTLDEIRAVFEEHGITAPPGFFAHLEGDRARDAGNMRVRYNAGERRQGFEGVVEF